MKQRFFKGEFGVIERIYYKEMRKLDAGLQRRNIKFIIRPYLGGLQILCKERRWNATCHDYSYGHENGLLEVTGLPQCNGDVIGYLTAKEILKMLDENS
jgi:hypothetical protein